MGGIDGCILLLNVLLVVVYQSTSIGTLFTPLPVSGVHDIFVFPELEQDKESFCPMA